VKALKNCYLPVFRWNVGSLSKADGIHGLSQSPAVTNSIKRNLSFLLDLSSLPKKLRISYSEKN
jgi:hypothetical protein